jgi:glyoxylase-like metal-dependent hydrolase (beta-lactamase superfamily II)
MHSGDAAVELVSEWLDNVQLQALAFADGPFAGFASSHDVFGDGAVVLLPMSGHTPGSMAVLVQQANGRTLLFIGDTAWAHEGVDWPAEKPWISRQLVDHNAADVVSQLVHLHQLQQINPGLQIIPAHDQRRYGLVDSGAR